jgi:hypothetical protein
MKLPNPEAYEAWHLGATAAKALKVGDIFLGAWGEADKQGITDKYLRSIFTEGFLQHLPQPVTTDHSCIIVRIGPIEHSA